MFFSARSPTRGGRYRSSIVGTFAGIRFSSTVGLPPTLFTRIPQRASSKNSGAPAVQPRDPYCCTCHSFRVSRKTDLIFSALQGSPSDRSILFSTRKSAGCPASMNTRAAPAFVAHSRLLVKAGIHRPRPVPSKGSVDSTGAVTEIGAASGTASFSSFAIGAISVASLRMPAFVRLYNTTGRPGAPVARFSFLREPVSWSRRLTNFCTVVRPDLDADAKSSAVNRRICTAALRSRYC